MLDRTVGKPEDQEQDNQLTQFVPDLNVVGKSSTLGQVCVPVITHIMGCLKFYFYESSYCLDMMLFARIIKKVF
jgi:hypothetical protein